MIPKVIHYCWFGGKPLPALALKCLESWKKFLPDYEIHEWNEDNFDVNSISYTHEAYKACKYAFVSDYARFYILYHHGGLYFDTDVEVVRPIDHIVMRGSFMGCENEVDKQSGGTALAVAPGLGLACEPGLDLYAEILALYAGLNFERADGELNLTTVVEYTTELLLGKGLKHVNEIQCVAGVWVYPKEYFCPIDYRTNVLNITGQTCAIHHYAASWISPRMKMKNRIIQLLGPKITYWVISIKKLLFQHHK